MATALDTLQKAQAAGLSAEPGKLVIKLPQNAMSWLITNDSLLDALEASTQRQLDISPGEKTEVYIRHD